MGYCHKVSFCPFLCYFCILITLSRFEFPLIMSHCINFPLCLHVFAGLLCVLLNRQVCAVSCRLLCVLSLFWTLKISSPTSKQRSAFGSSFQRYMTERSSKLDPPEHEHTEEEWIELIEWSVSHGFYSNSTYLGI